MDNQVLIDQLSILRNYYQQTGDKWRSLAYGRAIVSIRGLDFKIINIKQLKGVKHIGKSIAEKIQEYLTTGSIKKVEEVKPLLANVKKPTGPDLIFQEFQKIWGVGPVKARELYNKGMRSIEDIQKNQHLLTEQQQIGLKYFQELQESIPRDFITVFKYVLKYILYKTYGRFNLTTGRDTFKLEIAGSYRRQLKESGDIDCLISSKYFNIIDLTNTLKNWNVITDVLSVRVEKGMYIAHCPSEGGHIIRFDIEFVPEEEWATALLYFTGSQSLNIMMRAQAKKMGLTLNQHGLFKDGKRLETKTEKDVFDILGMKYLPPERR